jgi:hypothetical protein
MLSSSQTHKTNQIKNITFEVFEKKIDSPKEKESIIKNISLYNNKNENIILKTSDCCDNDSLSSCKKPKEEDEEDEDEDYIGGEAGEEEEEEDEEEECIVELFNIKIRGRENEYYTDNVDIYEIGEKDEIGPKVGKFVDGKAVMNK